jgi:hypothetical protein
MFLFFSTFNRRWYVTYVWSTGTDWSHREVCINARERMSAVRKTSDLTGVEFEGKSSGKPAPGTLETGFAGTGALLSSLMP